MLGNLCLNLGTRLNLLRVRCAGRGGRCRSDLGQRRDGKRGYRATDQQCFHLERLPERM